MEEAERQAAGGGTAGHNLLLPGRRATGAEVQEMRPAEAEGDRTLPPRQRILLLRRGGSECGGLAEGEEERDQGGAPH